MEDEEIKKFSASETMIGTGAALMVDGLCFLLDLIAIGLVLSPVIQTFANFCFGLWFRAKGNPAPLGFKRAITKALANFLPVVPTVTISFVVEVAIQNGVLGKVLNTASALNKAGAAAKKIMMKV